jgi:hypothetical protein
MIYTRCLPFSCCSTTPSRKLSLICAGMTYFRISPIFFSSFGIVWFIFFSFLCCSVYTYKKPDRCLPFSCCSTTHSRLGTSSGNSFSVGRLPLSAMFFSKTELLNRPVSGLISFRNWFSFGLDKHTNQFQFYTGSL